MITATKVLPEVRTIRVMAVISCCICVSLMMVMRMPAPPAQDGAGGNVVGVLELPALLAKPGDAADFGGKSGDDGMTGETKCAVAGQAGSSVGV